MMALKRGFVQVLRPSWKWKSYDPLHRLYSHYSQVNGSYHSPTPPSSPSLKCVQANLISESISNNFLKRWLTTQSVDKNFQSLGKPLFVEKKVFQRVKKPRQFLTSDKQTIVCIHPAKPALHINTMPLRPVNPAILQRRDSLTDEEVKLVRRLRAMDGALWTVVTLARHFNVKKGLISKVAPASLERQRELDREKALTASMKPYKRKLFKAQKQMERQKRLEKIVAKNRERILNLE